MSSREHDQPLGPVVSVGARPVDLPLVPAPVDPDTGRRPRLLDLFCCQGGAAMGYHRAGFDVVGVDIAPQPRYPFAFVQADALDYLAEHGHEFDAVHASPPCHDWSTLASTSGKDGTGVLLVQTLDALRALGVPWVVENVPGRARAVMPAPLRLCGSEFGLSAGDVDGKTVHLRRHRLFSASFPLVGAGGCHCAGARSRGLIAGSYGGGWDRRATRSDGRRGGYVPLMPVRRALLGCDWMTREGLSQAIPPAYTQFVGEQLLAHLVEHAA